jgi:hypothetical protein
MSAGTASLLPGESLQPDDYIISFNSLFLLHMQTEGNLVLLSRQPDTTWRPYWASGTNGTDRAECFMVTNGELLIGYPGASAVWSSGTGGHTQSRLVIHDDGSLVIYWPTDPIWATGTNRRYEPPAPPAGPNKGSRLAPGQFLMAGETLVSTNQRYRFALQTDGNLVLYDIDTAIWSSGTYGASVTALAMQTDANLVIYGPGGAVWSSGSYHKATNAGLTVQNDGNVVVYGTVPIWAQHF